MGPVRIAALTLVTALVASPAGAQLPPPPALPGAPPLGGSPPPGGNRPPPSGNQPPAPQGGPAGSPGAGSVALGVDAGHTGHLADPNVVPPLRRRWQQRLPDRPRAIVAADGRVFVLTDSRLFAFDAATGRPLWVRATVLGGMAYDAGRVIVTHVDQRAAAYDARTGGVLWSRQMPAPMGPPTADAGEVYIATRDGIVSLRAGDGQTRWTAAPGGGEVTLDRGRAFAGYGCGEARAFARSDGRLLWRHQPVCSGAVSLRSAVLGDRLYLSDPGVVLDATTGRRVGTHPGTTVPILAADVALIRTGEQWQAWNLQVDSMRWTSPCAPTRDPGQAHGVDSAFDAPWVAVYRALYRVTERGTLVACAVDTGRVTWAARTPAESADFAYLAAAPGMVLVGLPESLTAYESVYRPAPGGVAWAPERRFVEYRDWIGFEGVAGTALRAPGSRATLEFDEHPYGRWRRLTSAPLAPDGSFDGRMAPERNTRLRVRVGAAASPPLTVYAYPRPTYRTRRGRGAAVNRITTTMTLRFDPALRLAGRRVYLYIGRVALNRLDRIAAATLRARGPGRAVAVFRFPALHRVGARDFADFCIPRLWRLGMGPYNSLTRRCGAARQRVDLR
jgi:outer membrane protein assembly factor BamB